ncbi:MAG: aminotransferase class III-fold pyridoxal phosphate-dependent enzyme [Coriobacteriales bacterium]|jgi:acetylornithine aminotransferase|nr:aminotransferase class III-fold pyridoxal phosphate-dependent enzyme [Coriobacteriales bacterium]
MLSNQLELEGLYVMETYKRKLVTFVRGDGMRLYDATGKEYLDFLAGSAAVNAGHAHPLVTAAIKEQADKLLHVGNYFFIEGRGELAEMLSALLNSVDGQTLGDPDSPTWKTFFANSGTEAVEGCLKLARRYGYRYLDGAGSIVSAKKSFHGRTYGSLTATGQPSKQDIFKPLVPGFVSHVELNDIAALEKALDSETEAGKVAALLLEPIQGESGVWPCTQEYLQAARELTAERGQLLMLDEVQTGFYRTGTAFCFQGMGIIPDVVAMAKGLGNGMPIGAFAAHGNAATVLEAGDHGSTFGGSSLAVAVALASVRAYLQMNAGRKAIRVGTYLRSQLAELPGVLDIRGKGMMTGVTLSHPIANQVVDAALALAVKGGRPGFVLNATDAETLRFIPPLCCSEDEIDLLITALQECLAMVAA